MNSVADSGHFSVVLQTYNERDSVGALISDLVGLPQPPYMIVVVDDNSPDGTADVVKRCVETEATSIRLVSRPRRLGLATACHTGLVEAVRGDSDFVILMDADQSHSAADVSGLVAAAASFDLVIGSRDQWLRKQSRLGRSTHAIKRWYLRMVLGLALRDPVSGFRCIGRRLAEELARAKPASRGFAYHIETAHVCCSLGGKIGEVPITYTPRRFGVSKRSVGEYVESIWRPWVLRKQFQRCSPGSGLKQSTPHQQKDE